MTFKARVNKKKKLVSTPCNFCFCITAFLTIQKQVTIEKKK